MEKRTIENMLRSSAEKYGSITAISFSDKCLNYKELYSEVISLAAVFQQKGFNGKKVELIPELSAKWIIVFLALTTAGAVVVLHEPKLDVSEYINDIYITADSDQLYAYERCNVFSETTSEEDIAVIIFTSGTSGKNKGVMLSHKNIISDAMLGAEMIGEDALKAGDKTIPVLPVFHMFGITASFIAPFYIGMTVHIINDMKYVIKSLPEIQPRILFVVPMIAKTILSRVRLLLKNGMTHEMIKKQALGGLSIVVSGGAALQPELIDEFSELGIELLNGYGITECSPIVTNSSYRCSVRGSVGRINKTNYAEVRIIDGTVHVSGDIVMSGYCGDEPSPFKTIDGRKWFDTMDYGSVTKDGSLFINGRSSNVIILDDGNNTFPEEIELLFEKYDVVDSVLVYEKENSIFASIYLYQEMVSELSSEKIAKLVADIVCDVNKDLPAYKRVKKWNIRKEDFHRTSMKKIIRSEVNYDE